MEDRPGNSDGNNSCRKRGRSEDADCDECMPISKRINRLCIRQSLEGWNGREDEANSTAFNNVPLGPDQCCQSWPHPQASPCLQMPGAGPGPWQPHPHHVPPTLEAHRGPVYPQPRAPTPDSRVPSTDSGVDFGMDDYEPELTEVQNPMYYRINGMLFEANRWRIERLSRVNSQTGEEQGPDEGHHGNWGPSLHYPHQ